MASGTISFDRTQLRDELLPLFIYEAYSASEYSKLVGDLISECGTSVFWTCPYTPVAWFKTLNVRGLEAMLNSGNELNEDHFPYHVKAFLRCPLNAKRRLVVLDDNEWESLTGKSGTIEEKTRMLNAFNEFCRLSNSGRGVWLGWVRETELRTQAPRLAELARKDFGVYDGKVVITYEPIDDNKIGNGKLKLLIDEDEVSGYAAVFGTLMDSLSNIVRTCDDIRQDVTANIKTSQV